MKKDHKAKIADFLNQPGSVVPVDRYGIPEFQKDVKPEINNSSFQGFQNSTNTESNNSGNTENWNSRKERFVKLTIELSEENVKKIKQFMVDNKKKQYEAMEEIVDAFFNK